jgi:hypothetical protein
MAAGTLRLANVTVFEANTTSGNIKVPTGTTLEGITDILDLSLNSAAFSTSTNILSLGNFSGNTVTVDLSTLSGGGGGGASLGDVTALAIALG